MSNHRGEAEGETPDEIGRRRALRLLGATTVLGLGTGTRKARAAGPPLDGGDGDVRSLASTTTTTWSQQQKLAPSGAGSGSELGRAIATDGTTAAVGAPGTNAVYVFELLDGTWTRQQTITANRDKFGTSVAVDGDVLLVGGVHDSEGAYVYVRGSAGWTRQDTISPPADESQGLFGEAVEVQDGTALIGSPAETTQSAIFSGAVHVFERTDGTWTWRQRVVPDSAGYRDRFGTSITAHRSLALIGAPRHDATEAIVDTGALYEFQHADQQYDDTYGPWLQTQKLTVEDGGGFFSTSEKGDEFGDPIASDGKTAFVGARNDEVPNGADSGAVYVFERELNTWSFKQKLTPADGDRNDLFGYAVGVDGDTAVVGAVSDEGPNGTGAGSAYVFSRENGTWTQQAKIAPDDGDSEDRFGWAAAVSSGSVLVGAIADEDPNGKNAGAVYTFKSSTTRTDTTTLSTYSGSDDVIQTSELRAIFQAWTSGDVPTEQLRRAIEVWVSQNPV